MLLVPTCISIWRLQIQNMRGENWFCNWITVLLNARFELDVGRTALPASNMMTMARWGGATVRYADCLGLTVTKTSTYLSPYSSVQLSLQVPPPYPRICRVWTVCTTGLAVQLFTAMSVTSSYTRLVPYIKRLNEQTYIYIWYYPCLEILIF